MGHRQSPPRRAASVAVSVALPVWAVMACAPALLCLAACSGDKDDLSVQQLSQVVDQQRGTLKACYDAALEKHPYTSEVRMNAVIRIDPGGSVREVEFAETGLPGMPECLRAAIKAWRFPAAKEETHTSLPIIFKPETK